MQFDPSFLIQIKRIKHCPKMGDHFLMQNQNTGEVYVKKTHLTTEKSKHEEYNKQYTYRIQNVCPYLITCYDFK